MSRWFEKKVLLEEGGGAVVRRGLTETFHSVRLKVNGGGNAAAVGSEMQLKA